MHRQIGIKTPSFRAAERAGHWRTLNIAGVQKQIDKYASGHWHSEGSRGSWPLHRHWTSQVYENRCSPADWYARPLTESINLGIKQSLLSQFESVQIHELWYLPVPWRCPTRWLRGHTRHTVLVFFEKYAAYVFWCHAVLAGGRTTCIGSATCACNQSVRYDGPLFTTELTSVTKTCGLCIP